MRKLKVFCTPTQANKAVVSKLQRLMGFDRFKFVELPQGQAERIRFLQRIPHGERAAFIWGDGNAHHESHYFTIGDNIRFKINLDDHDDGYPHINPNLVPERDKGLWIARWAWKIEGWECGRVSEVLWNNHMKSTFEQGKDTMTEINTEERLERAVRFVLEYPELCGSATIDTDGLICFPCKGKWTTETGLLPQRVIDAVSTVSAKLIRLDIGGLTEKMTNFELVDVDLAIPPSLKESIAFVFAGTGDSRVDISEIPGNRLNYVGSYAIFTYARLLESFAKS